MWIVAKDGTGDFRSIGEALLHLEKCLCAGGRDEERQAERCTGAEDRRTEADSRAEDRTILVKKGEYRERIVIRIPGLRLIGEDRRETIITEGYYAMMPSDDIGKLGTFRTYTMLVDADHAAVSGITVKNDAGSGREIGQAIALYCYGDGLEFQDMDILGCMDTLFTGPLPEKERIPGGFTGPTEQEPRRPMRMRFRNCRIEGDIDFIYGGAAAFFEGCEIVQKQHPASGTGYAAAPSTPEGQEYGYVFDRCRFIGAEDCPDGSVYLARPWRKYGKTVILRSYLGPQLAPSGWSSWDRNSPEERCFFAEYGNYGPGASEEAMAERPDWVRQLTEAEADRICSGLKQGRTRK